MLTQINNTVVNIPRSMKLSRLACLTTATLTILCIGLTVLSSHVTQFPKRRLAADWRCSWCNCSENDSERTTCKLCGTPKPVWKCSQCEYDNDSDRRTCEVCGTDRRQRQDHRPPVRAPSPEAPEMPHCGMNMCYTACDDCEGKGCNSCEETGHAYVCPNGDGCGWAGTRAQRGPGGTCPEQDMSGRICGLEVYVVHPKDLVYLRCNHFICKSCFNKHIETVIRDDTISCPIDGCNYEVQDDELQEYMGRAKFNRRNKILRDKLLAEPEGGFQLCPKNAETGCTWGYYPAPPRPCEGCGGQAFVTVRRHGTWMPWSSSHDSETECARCIMTPGVEPVQAHAERCQKCSFHFCTSCKKEWNHGRRCPEATKRGDAKCRYGKIKVSTGGFTGFFGATKKVDCGECDGRGHVDIRTHDDKTCEQYAVALSTTDQDIADQRHEQDDEATRRWKIKHTKQCPSCHKPVHKSGAAGETDGCNHMTCRCGKQFCWTCGADAAPDKCWTSFCVEHGRIVWT